MMIMINFTKKKANKMQQKQVLGTTAKKKGSRALCVRKEEEKK